jgi:hypothetical protein
MRHAERGSQVGRHHQSGEDKGSHGTTSEEESWSQDKRDAAFRAHILVMVIGHHSSAFLCKMIDAGAGQTLAIMTSSLLLQRLTFSVNGLLVSLGPWRM